MVEAALLTVIQPAAVEAARAAEALAAGRRDEAGEALARDLQAARYDAERAFRQYDAANPENRFVAGELEARWNRALTRVAEIDRRIAGHDATTPREADPALPSFTALADDLEAVWSAPTTDARLRKRIVRTVIHEAIADLDEAAAEIVIVIHWMGGAHSELVEHDHVEPEELNSQNPGLADPGLFLEPVHTVEFGADRSSRFDLMLGRRFTVC